MLEFTDTVPAVAARLRNGTLLPFLGAGVTALSAPSVPVTHEALAAWLGSKVALPKRARGNCWAAAQYIESSRFRATLDALMAAAFAPPVTPGPLHAAIARLAPALVVDTWYDAALRTAYAGVSGWGEIHGASRSKPGESRWYRAYDADGTECPVAAAEGWKSLIYKPHGCVTPVGNFLISDADYVEVLTEIDIQTPIPVEVQARRASRGFVFVGCRFHDQMLRTYARQIMKRSAGPHFAIVDTQTLTRNEAKFLVDHAIAPIVTPLADVAATLIG